VSFGHDFAFRLTNTPALAEAFYLRGCLISVVAGLEAELDDALHAYWGMRDLQSAERLLAALNWSQKLDLVRKMCEELHLVEDLRYLLDALRRAGEWRNEVAHSVITIDIETPLGQGITDPSELDPRNGQDLWIGFPV